LQYENKEAADAKTGIVVQHITFLDTSNLNRPLNLTDGVLQNPHYLSKDAKVVFMGEVENRSGAAKRVMVVTDVEYVLGKVEEQKATTLTRLNEALVGYRGQMVLGNA